MTIEDRIKNIQGKSENVRMAYILVLVTVVMTFVVVLWIFSIRVDVQAVVNDVSNVTALPDDGGQLQGIKDAINSSNNALEEVMQQPNGTANINDGNGVDAAIDNGTVQQ